MYIVEVFDGCFLRSTPGMWLFTSRAHNATVFSWLGGAKIALSALRSDLDDPIAFPDAKIVKREFYE